jgi:hypothetical protein
MVNKSRRSSAVGRLNSSTTPLYGGVEDRQAIGAEENDNPTPEAPDIVHALNQSVDGHLIFMMAVILRSRCRQ